MAPKREDNNEENAGVKPKLATSLQGGNGCEMLSKTKVAETACVKSPPVTEARGNKSVGGEGVLSSDAGKEMESSGEVDDELTNLTWLQNCNLLQGMSNVELSEQLPQSPSSKIHNAQKSTSNQNTNAFGVDELYNPTVHRHAKPPYSFSCLIFMAIEDSQSKALPVKDKLSLFNICANRVNFQLLYYFSFRCLHIYNWIYSHFPYFRSAPNGWRNSIRHNLSLSKCFYKVDKGQNIAKGSLWCVDPKYRHHLLHSLNKTSHAHFNQGIKIPTLNSAPQLSEIEISVAEISHKHLVDPIGRHEKGTLISSPSVPKVSNSSLFPYLSKRLTGTSSKNVEEDAAATMLALKNGSLLDCAKQKKLQVPEKIQTELSNLVKRGEKSDVYQVEIEFNKSNPRVTCHFLPPMSHCVPISTSRPSKDHTYSTADENESEKEMEEEIDDQPLELTTKSQVGQSTNTAQIQNKDDHNWKRKDFDNMIVNKSTMAGKYFKKRRCESKVEEVDEEQKIVESADALLNLAGIITSGSENTSQVDLETDERPRRQRKPSRRNLRHLVR